MRSVAARSDKLRRPVRTPSCCASGAFSPVGKGDGAADELSRADGGALRCGSSERGGALPFADVVDAGEDKRFGSWEPELT